MGDKTEKLHYSPSKVPVIIDRSQPKLSPLFGYAPRVICDEFKEIPRMAGDMRPGRYIVDQEMCASLLSHRNQTYFLG